MSSAHWIPVPNTKRLPLARAREVGSVDGSEPIDVTVYVRRNPSARLPSERMLFALPSARQKLTKEDIAAAFSADPQDISKVEEFAKAAGLQVRESSISKRSVFISGTAERMMAAFNVDLRYYEYPFGRFRGRVGSVCVPSGLNVIVEAVFGLDNRRTGRSYLRHWPDAEGVQGARSAVGHSPTNMYFPPQVAQLYNYPRGLDGTGQCIGILAFNDIHHGGYRIEAIRTYFNRLQIPMPSIVDNVVHGLGNDPGDDSPAAEQNGDSSGEIMLDIQVAGSVAPGARIAMYFTEFTERGWVDALHTAVTDTENSPSVLSISYGNPEDANGTAWTGAAIAKVNEAFQIAAAKRITVCCASGDQGSADLDAPTRQVHVDFPASSPLVLACGGTRLVSFAGVIVSETVWNDGPDERGGLAAGGGGVSKLFPLPAYQNNANVPPVGDSVHHVGRGVPDVSGLADPATPLAVMRLNGSRFNLVGGTSVTAPLWAALIARINQGIRTQLGFINPSLYMHVGAKVWRDITIGNNGYYRALPGWDACTGLGSPDGVRLLQALSGVFTEVIPASHAGSFCRTDPISIGYFTCVSCGRSLPMSECLSYPWGYPLFYRQGLCTLCYTRRLVAASW
jgi:kumamolisin